MPTPASDPTAGLPDDGLPPWAAELLRRPPAASPDELARARSRVMAQVRRAPRHGRPLARAYRLGAAAPRWARRRGLLAPAGSAAAAALLALALGGAGLAPAGARAPLGAALGAALVDTVTGGPGALWRAPAGPFGTTVAAAVRDTLRVARAALGGGAAGGAAYAAAGRGPAAWRPVPAAPRDALRFAFVAAGAGARGSALAAPTPAGRPATAGDST
jgi:hypothetical protein